MTTERTSGDAVGRVLASAVSATGLVILLWSIVEAVGLFASGSPVVFQPRYLVGFVTIVPSCVGMVAAGRWLRRSDLPAEYERQAAVYGLVGGVVFLAFNAGLMTFFPTGSVWFVTSWTRWALSLGLATGLLIGIAQARAIYHTLAADRQSIRAEHVEKQRDLVDHMNGILRHEVLNATQVILGNAASLREDDEQISPTDERLARIYRQGEDVTAVIQEVRSLLVAMDADRALTSVSLAPVVRTEARKVTDRYPDATVEVEVPPDAAVTADGLIGRIFGNLLSNAAEHNADESVRIDVAATVADESVVVTVRDDGGGIPESKLDRLFDRPQQGDHGLGLYLVAELTRSYGGSIHLRETGASGTTFELRFPRAVPDSTTDRDRPDSAADRDRPDSTEDRDRPDPAADRDRSDAVR